MEVLMQVPLLDLKRQYHEIKDEVKAALEGVLESGHFIMGEQVKEFEQKMAAYAGVKHAIGVASGTDALLIALHALNIGPGDEVIVPTFTFFATAGAVVRLGGTPVFADIRPDTFNLDPDQLEALITPRTKAIIPVHLYGQLAEMEKIMAIAKKYNLAVIEDACQAIGARYKSAPVGSFGQATALSFFPSKNLGAYGDAGMILTNDSELADRMSLLRVHGAKPKYYHHIVGYNSRLDSMQAAILNVKLPYVDQWTAKRITVATKYAAAFTAAGLAQQVQLPVVLEDYLHVYHQYCVRVAKRDQLQAYLKEHGIETAIYYPRSLHEQPCFADLGYKPGDLPVAEAVSRDILALPIDPELSDIQIDYVVSQFKAFYNL